MTSILFYHIHKLDRNIPKKNSQHEESPFCKIFWAVPHKNILAENSEIPPSFSELFLG